MSEVKEVSINAHYFRCTHCGSTVVVGDYYLEEARRLCEQYSCQDCAEGEIKTLWNS